MFLHVCKVRSMKTQFASVPWCGELNSNKHRWGDVQFRTAHQTSPMIHMTHFLKEWSLLQQHRKLHLEWVVQKAKICNGLGSTIFCVLSIVIWCSGYMTCPSGCPIRGQCMKHNLLYMYSFTLIFSHLSLRNLIKKTCYDYFDILQLLIKLYYVTIKIYCIFLHLNVFIKAITAKNGTSDLITCKYVMRANT